MSQFFASAYEFIKIFLKTYLTIGEKGDIILNIVIPICLVSINSSELIWNNISSQKYKLKCGC